jgi:hypothetical protein
LELLLTYLFLCFSIICILSLILEGSELVQNVFATFGMGNQSATFGMGNQSATFGMGNQSATFGMGNQSATITENQSIIISIQTENSKYVVGTPVRIFGNVFGQYTQIVNEPIPIVLTINPINALAPPNYVATQANNGSFNAIATCHLSQIFIVSMQVLPALVL